LLLDFVGTIPSCNSDTIMAISVWKALFKREIILNNKIEFVSERKMISEDLIFDIDFLSKCSKIIGINDYLYAYCTNPSSLSKKYRIDRFDMEIALYHEVIKKLQGLGVDNKEIILRTDRFLIARSRVDIFQIFKYNHNKRIKQYKELLDNICDNNIMKQIYQRYKYKNFPFKYKLVLFLQKNKYYHLLYILSLLKN